MQDSVIRNATERAEKLSIRLETVTEIATARAKRYAVEDTLVSTAARTAA